MDYQPCTACTDIATTWAYVSHEPCEAVAYEIEQTDLPADLRANFPDAPEVLYRVPLCAADAAAFTRLWVAVFGDASTRPMTPLSR